MGWDGEGDGGGSGKGTHVHPWLIHIGVWQKPLQYCKIISFQLKEINFKNNDKIKCGELVKGKLCLKLMYKIN